MTRALSDTAVRAGHAVETDEVWITLITITHASLEDPLRFNDAGVEVVSNGETFFPFPFTLPLPSESEDMVKHAKIVIDNVDRQVMAAVRALRPAPDIQIQIVLASDFDHVEMELPPIPLRGLHADTFSIEGTIADVDLGAEPFSGHKITPASFPGMF